jgi:hypothetical protein
MGLKERMTDAKFEKVDPNTPQATWGEPKKGDEEVVVKKPAKTKPPKKGK